MIYVTHTKPSFEIPNNQNLSYQATIETNSY